MTKTFACRPNCGACCIAPSISSAIPNMSEGKPASVACIHLDEHFACRIFGSPDRSIVCQNLKPCYEMCGENRQHALNYLSQLERLTKV